jgi:hypothetical protein
MSCSILERRTALPLLRIERLADRAVGGGLVLMLAAAGSIFGLFLLTSLYLQNVLGWGPLSTGLAFIPLALAAGAGAHGAGHIVGKHGVRGPLAGAFLLGAAGMALLAHVGEDGSYLRDVLPGMLVAGLGLGVAVVSVSIAILTGARDDETGMISGLNSTGHELGGTVGIAIFSTIAAGGGAVAGPQAASGIAHAFIAAGLLASVASLVALAVLPQARHFVPKLRLNPSQMPILSQREPSARRRAIPGNLPGIARPVRASDCVWDAGAVRGVRSAHPGDSGRRTGLSFRIGLLVNMLGTGLVEADVVRRPASAELLALR